MFPVKCYPKLLVIRVKVKAYYFLGSSICTPTRILTFCYTNSNLFSFHRLQTFVFHDTVFLHHSASALFVIALVYIWNDHRDFFLASSGVLRALAELRTILHHDLPFLSFSCLLLPPKILRIFSILFDNKINDIAM